MMKSVGAYLSKVPIDKVLHFIVGYLTFIVSFTFIKSLGYPIGTCVVAGVIIVAVIGSLKEAFDYISPSGTCDPMDLVATVLGVVPSLVTIYITYET